MKAIHLRSHVGADGVLNVRVPPGLTDSDLDVLIVVDTATHTSTDDWNSFVKSTAGSIKDDSFVRHDCVPS